MRTMIVALVLIVAGCGSESECERLGSVTCDRACSCAEGDACRVSTAAGGATITFDSESDCRGFLVTFGCSGDEPTVVDPVACADAVEAAACVPTAEGMAVAYPEIPACEDVE